MRAKVERLSERFQQVTEPSMFVDALRELVASVQTNEVGVDEGASLAVNAIADASTMEGWTRDGSLPLMVDVVASLYLTVSEPEDAEGLSRAADLRRALERWVASLPGSAPETVAEQLNTAMLSGRNEGLSRSRLYMLRWTGLRLDRVEGALLERGGQDDEIGRMALHTLALLGPGEEVCEKLSAFLMERLEVSFDREVAQALTALAQPDVLERVLRAVGSPGPETPELRRRVVSFAAALAGRHPADDELQSRVLELILQLVGEDPKFRGELALRGDWLVRLNSSALVPKTLALAGGDDVSDHVRHLFLIRLEDIETAKQLAGWRRSELAGALVERATSDTRTDRAWVGKEWRYKEAAWNALLAARGTGALTDAIRGVDTEANPYLYRQLATRLASLAIPSVPESAREIASTDYDCPKTGDDEGYALRLGALRLLRSCPPIEAVGVLSSWRFTYKGHALTEVVRSFAEVAAEAHRANPVEVRAALERMSRTESPSWQRISAAQAGLALESAEADAGAVLQRAMRAVEKERDPTERALLIAGVERLPSEIDLPPELAAALKDWARSDNQLLARNSALALAGTGLLRTEELLLKDLTGLEYVDSAYRWTRPRATPRFAGQLICLMAKNDPSALTSATLELVEGGPWEVAVGLTPAFPKIAAWRPSARRELIDVVRARALKQSAHQAETDWFHALAGLSCDAFLEVCWREAVDWMPAALVTLAGVLQGTRPTSDVGNQQLRNHLEFLCRSPHFAVRRAAYRAIVEAAPEFALQLVASWAAATGVDVRLRAAEAQEWLPSEKRELLHGELISDSVRRVRDAARRSAEEGTRRANLHEILDIVSGIDGSNDSICAVWAHVEVLRRSGDDTVAERLRAIIEASGWPSRVVGWLTDVTSDIEKRWRSANQDWPSPWHRWDGAVEELDAILTADGEKFLVRVFLWKAATDYGAQEWGGAVVEADQNTIPLFGMEEFRLELSDGRVGRALRQRYATGVVSFVGLGAYPAPE